MSCLILCAMLLASETVPGQLLESGYSNDDGVIRVSVFIDLSKEKNIKFPEGTALLRASRLLHKACPELPDKYNVTGRVLTNSHNRVEKTYYYVVEYDPQSIEAVVEQAAIDAEKAREAELFAAEKTAEEKTAAESHENEAMPKGALCANGSRSNIVSTNVVVQVNVSATNDAASATNTAAAYSGAESAKTCHPAIKLVDLTVRDIKEKMVKPKVSEKNGFKQVDVDSFDGIDPLEE